MDVNIRTIRLSTTRRQIDRSGEIKQCTKSPRLIWLQIGKWPKLGLFFLYVYMIIEIPCGLVVSVYNYELREPGLIPSTVAVVSLAFGPPVA